MQRLIVARKKLSFDKNFRDVVNNNDFSDQKIANIIINSTLFKKLINNKKLSNSQIFDKLIEAKLGQIAKIILKELLSNNKIFNQIKVYNFNEVIKNIIQYIKINLDNNESDLYKEINLHIYNVFHKSNDKSIVKSIDNIADLKKYLHNKRNIELSDLLSDIIESAVFNFICYNEDETNAICEAIKASFIKRYPKGIISKDELNQFLQERVMSIKAFYFKYFQGNKLPIIKELIKDIYTHDNNVEIEYNDHLDNDLRIYMPSDLIHDIFIRSCKNVLNSKFYLDRIGVKKIIKKSGQYNDKYIQNLTIEKICENKNIEYTQQQFNNSVKNVSSNYQYYLGLNDSWQRFKKLPEYLFRSIVKYINNVKSINELMNVIKSKISADNLFKIRQSFINNMDGISDPAVKQIVTDILLSIFPKGNFTIYRNTNLMKSVANILYKNTQFKNCVFIGLEKSMSSLSNLITKLFIRADNTTKDKNKEYPNKKYLNKEYQNKKVKTNQKEEAKIVDKSQVNFKLKQNNNDNNLRNMSLQQIKNLPTLPSLNRKNDNVGDQENISLANYYQTKIIISSDGNIKYLPPNNNIQYINELTNKNLNYAIGTITDNGIVCIHKNNNMNINDIVNICKKDSQINKIYELNEQVNLAARIIRRAKLAKLIWKK